MTFRRKFDEDDPRRSYSICAGLDDGELRVGIKRVDGGAFSTWANEELRPGAVLEAMPPMGSFHHLARPGCRPPLPRLRRRLRHHAGPLDYQDRARPRAAIPLFTLVYANRQISSIMFREELEDLKNRHLGRLSILHILETEAQDIDLFTGRVDGPPSANSSSAPGSTSPRSTPPSFAAPSR